MRKSTVKENFKISGPSGHSSAAIAAVTESSFPDPPTLDDTFNHIYVRRKEWWWAMLKGL